jgi:TRAP-type C4-dicarboxylate transport system permease small subunit
MRSLVLRLDRWVTPTCMFLACALLCVVVCLGTFQVITRFVFEQPSTWTEEILRRLLIWAVFLGVVPAFRTGALVSVDMMLRLSSGAWHTVVRAIILVASLILLVALVYAGFDLAWRVRLQSFSSAEWLSMGWAYLAVPVGALCSIVAVLASWYDYQSTELETAQ